MIRLIDLGMAKFHGEAPYPRVTKAEIIKYPHLDPSLANGGACSTKTDIYSFGKVLSELYRQTGCFVYR